MSVEQRPGVDPTRETSRVKTPEREVTPEQRELVESATKFAEYLISRWPQVDTSKKPAAEVDDGTAVGSPELPERIEVEQRMNYYLSGSLASMLLSRAERFTEMDETQIPLLADTHTR